jgi:hypothetical protein
MLFQDVLLLQHNYRPGTLFSPVAVKMMPAKKREKKKIKRTIKIR